MCVYLGRLNSVFGTLDVGDLVFHSFLECLAARVCQTKQRGMYFVLAVQPCEAVFFVSILHVQSLTRGEMRYAAVQPKVK